MTAAPKVEKLELAEDSVSLDVESLDFASEALAVALAEDGHDSPDDQEFDVEQETTGRHNNDRAYTVDLVQKYLTDIGKTPLLTVDQEIELAKSIEAGLAADNRLREAEEAGVQLDPELKRDLQTIVSEGQRDKDHFWEANLRLVVSIAKRYTGRGMAFLDVIQEGNIGLLRAIEKFDYTKGYKFSTYATGWIRSIILVGLADKGSAIRKPAGVVESMRQVGRTARDLTVTLGREPTPKEIGDVLKMDEEEVEELQGYDREPISLDAPTLDGDGTLLEVLARRDRSEGSEARAQIDRRRAEVEELLAHLDERSAEIMRLRHGLDGSAPRTLDEVGTILKLSRERIRQLEKLATKRLRDLAEHPDGKPS